MKADYIKTLILSYVPPFLVGLMLSQVLSWTHPFTDAFWLDIIFISAICVATWYAVRLLKIHFNKNGLGLMLLVMAAIILTGQKYLYLLVAHFYWAWFIVYLFAFAGGLLLGVSYSSKEKFPITLSGVLGLVVGYVMLNHIFLFILVILPLIAYGFFSEMKLPVKIIGVVSLITFGTLGFQEQTQLFARQKKYTDQVIFSDFTRMHKVDVTTWRGEYWYYLNNQNRLSSLDDYLYHEPMVHPAMSLFGKPNKVLVLGGELGGTLREVAKYQDVKEIVVVPLDLKLIERLRDKRLFQEISKGVWNDQRITIADEDIFAYLQQNTGVFDVVIADLPDPASLFNNQYYTVEFYQLCKMSLAPNGIFATQAGSPYFATKAFYTTVATMKRAGFYTVPYHNQILTLGEWGWVLGTETEEAPRLVHDLEFEVDSLTWLDSEAMRMMLSFGKITSDTSNIQINSLKEPSTFIYYTQGNWSL